MSAGSPVADLLVTELSVRRLIDAQFPDLADLPLTLFAEGWDNAMFRLGDDLVARIPRRNLAISYLRNEQDWLGALAPWLPVSTPAPLRKGAATDEFPAPWTIAPWIEGSCADQAPPDPEEALRLANFLRALHRDPPDAAPANDARGVPLSRRASDMDERLARLRKDTNSITPEIDVIWAQALAAPEATRKVWLHGDLHPQNVLTHKGAIAGVIDWGDICAGDPATDLAAFWMLVEDNGARAAGVAAYGADPDLIARAKGWAVVFGAVLLESGLVNDPRHAASGAETLRRLTRCPI